jgi:hypothetical protein
MYSIEIQPNANSIEFQSLFDTFSIFVLMVNWFQTDVSPVIRFDFKGSSLGRQSVQQIDVHLEIPLDYHSITLKELDFMNMIRLQLLEPIELSEQYKVLLLTQVKQDTALLSQFGFMDYRYFELR